MIAAIDFDGTLVSNKWPYIGTPIQQNVDYVLGLGQKGWRLILWTCRAGESLDQAVDFCRDKLGLVFDAVNDNLPDMIEAYGGNQRKIMADIYLDDKALNPSDLKPVSPYRSLCQRR